MKRDEQKFLSFKPFSALLPPNNPKNQDFEKMKKALGDISFYTSVPYMTMT